MKNKKSVKNEVPAITLALLEKKTLQYVDKRLSDSLFYILESNDYQMLCCVLKTGKFKISNTNGIFHHYEAVVEKQYFEPFILEVNTKTNQKNDTNYDKVGCQKFTFYDKKEVEQKLEEAFAIILFAGVATPTRIVPARPKKEW